MDTEGAAEGGGRDGALAQGGAGQALQAPVCDGPGCCPAELAPVLYTEGLDAALSAVAGRCHVTFAGADVVVLQAGAGGAGGAVVAGGGADAVYGGAGDDALRGGAGPDALHGGGGADRLLGDAGADAVYGGAGDDELRGGAGADALHGDGGADVLLGGAGADVLFGGLGADRVDGGSGADALFGGPGADTLWPGVGVDVVWAGGGDDRVEVYASCELGWGEVLAGGPGHDVLVLPAPLVQVQAQGVYVTGFEEVVVEPHPCRSACAGQVAPALEGAQPCGPGTCVETGGESFTCACPPEREGAECELCAPGYAGAACERCAAGFHLEGEDGQDLPIPPGADFDAPVAGEEPVVRAVCVPDETCAGVDCGLGTCQEEGGLARCQCPAHRVGVDAQGTVCGRCAPGYEADPNDPSGACVLGEACAQARCGGRGVCEAAPVGPGAAHTEVVCACAPGYAGAACQVCAPGHHGVAQEDLGVVCVPDETCVPDTCSGQGTCAVEGGRAVCTCDSGYYGADCSETCVDNTCNDGGTCVVQADRPVCQCDDPGRDPATDCGACRAGYEPGAGGPCVLQAGCGDPQACAGHGTCSAPDPASHTCACDPGWAGVTCDECEAGYLRLGEACVPAASCDAEGCGGQGTCQVSGGEASCACDDGFYGARCQLTNPPTQVEVTGAQASLGPGQARVLSAQLAGIADFERDLVWTLADGPGVLTPQADGTAVYTAPAGAGGAGGVDQARITVAPACCEGDAVDVDLPLVTKAEWIEYQRLDTPYAGAFAAFDQAMLDYMWDRCVGALAVAVQRDGQVVYAAGYGRTQGAPTGQGNSVWNTRCNDAYDASGAVMHPSNPMRVGSSSKSLLAAMVRWAVRRQWPSATDQQIEAIGLCEDHPEVGTVLPEGVRRVLCGVDPLPVDVYADVAGPTSCTPAACANGGMCSLVQGQPTCACPLGYTGARCQLLFAWTVAPPHFADPRWQQVTLGQLMSHFSGHPGSASQDDTLRRLAQLRGYAGLADLQAAEAAADAANPSGLAALHGPLQGLRGTDGDPQREAFFVPQPDLRDIYMVTPYRALASPPGSGYRYVNGNFSIQHLIIEQLTGLPFAPRYDLPGVSWPGSALAQFLESEGLTGGERSQWGIFPSPVVEAQREPNEPLYRQWSSSQESWSPVVGDTKVPDCVFDAAGLACDVEPWLAQNGQGSTRYGWGAVKAGAVHVAYSGSGISPGQGSMAVELPQWLRLMGRYTVSVNGGDPYARPRPGMEDSLAHNGLWPSFAASYAAQFGTNESFTVVGGPCTLGAACTVPGEGMGLCIYMQTPAGPQPQPLCVRNPETNVRRYVVPPPDPGTGALPIGVGDANLRTFTCAFPEGVDLVVAVAQAADPVSPQGVAGPYGTGWTTGRLRGYALHALCSVDWQEVQP